MEAPRSREYTSAYDEKYISSFPRRHYFGPKSNLALSFSLSILEQSLIGSKSISQTGGSCSALPRCIDDGSYTCGAGQRIGVEAERNRLIKMLIARLVRRPPAMSARSSAGVASRGVWEYLPLNLRPFSRFPFLSFFTYFARLFIVRWIPHVESGLFSRSLSCVLDRRKLTVVVMKPEFDSVIQLLSYEIFRDLGTANL